MDKQELKTTAITAIEKGNKAVSRAGIFGRKTIRLATGARFKIGDRFPQLSSAPERSRAQEAMHSPAFWAFGGGLAAAAAATLKPVREQIITTGQKVRAQVTTKATEYIGGKPQDARAYEAYGRPQALSTEPGMPTVPGQTDEMMEEARPGNPITTTTSRPPAGGESIPPITET